MQIFGHRGASAYAPENTIPSFELAVEQGVDGVEFDVHLTSDGVPVVIHDETADRTTSGTGAILDLTCAELQAFDASNGMPGFEGVRVPTLAEVFEALAPSGIVANIELKNSVVFYEGLEEKVLEVVDACQMADRVIVSSFNHLSLRHIQQLRGRDFPLGVLYQDVLWEPWRYVKELGMPAIHPWIEMIDAGYVATCHEAGLLVRAWTVDGEWLPKAFAWGVDAVITNTPDVAVGLRG